ncbi:hypothetical protein ACIA58_21020 [Kribbella sp. NPDC051586]|uniref:hypothetical protein n=1 Tax=Kribbella sp. NPDC051586 TaxID=3364118 RepID=UPI00379C3A93
MSFLDLTPAWTDQSLTDPRVAADVVDLMLTLGDRQRGTLAVILCDPDDRYRATITVDLPSEFDRLDPAIDTSQLCSTALRPIVAAVQTAPGTGVILALGRPGPARSPVVDLDWANAGTAICHAARLRLLGFYLATGDGVYQPPVNHPLTDQPRANLTAA